MSAAGMSTAGMSAAGMSAAADTSSAGSSGSGNGASGNGAPSAGTGAGGEQCNEIQNLGLDVMGKMAPGPFPSLGAHTSLPDGVYVLSSSTWYANTAPASQVRKRTLMILGNQMQTVTSENYGPDERLSFTLNPVDYLNQVPTCGIETDWDKDKQVAWGISRPGSIDIREPYGMWSHRIDTYLLVK